MDFYDFDQNVRYETISIWESIGQTYAMAVDSGGKYDDWSRLTRLIGMIWGSFRCL